MNTTRLTDKTLKTLNRPDSNLPSELRHEDIHETRDKSARDRAAFQIVFDRTWLPYRYARNIRKAGWEIEYARVEHHDTYDGLLGLVMPKQACLTIVVAKDIPDDILGGDAE